ncbi:unnamed protein product [Moneuplotes crassus]|uniref:Uncharacterized protein n=1 Tax=Euplotes crassus TaxID=5936 RepID=A0AAD1Y9V7_EUPCR|nr:unnamed protein product [Moneuplotes crassus]
MRLPICEIGSCQNESQDYIVDKEVYVCHAHKVAKYSSDDSIHLISPESVELLLKVIDQCREEVLVSSQLQGYLAPESEYRKFDTCMTEEIEGISSSLETAIRTKQFLKLEALFHEAKKLETSIMNEQLFIKHSTVRSWKKALAVVDGTLQKNGALFVKELREKYGNLFETTTSNFKNQKDRILKEKSELSMKLSEEAERVKALEEELVEQEKSYKQELKTQEIGYEEKIKGLAIIQSELEQTKLTLTKETEKKNHEISELKEDIKNKSDDLKGSREQIEELKQKDKVNIEKNNNLRERIKNLRLQFTEEKKALEDSHNDKLQQLRNHYNLQLKESSEKSEKDIQEKLAIFNNKYQEKNDVIHKLEKKVSKLTEDLDQERTDHQALMTTHTNLEKEKQSLMKEHAKQEDLNRKLQDQHKTLAQRAKNSENLHKNQLDKIQQRHLKDATKLEQNNAALEEESKAKDIKILKLRDEIEELIKKLDHALEDKERIKLNLVSSIQTYSNQEVTDLLKDCRVYNIFGEPIQFDQTSNLPLDLRKGNLQEFLTKINKRIPDCKFISIESIPGENEVVKTFLSLYFPNKVEQFYFNDRSDLSSCLSFYMTALEALSSKVEEEFVIYNFEVSQHQMKTLLAKYKRKRRFGFLSCKLALSSVPDFGGALQGSQLKALGLNGCGSSDLGDWKNNPAHFENLIEGLAKEQDFKDNLKWIGMEDCGMEESQVEVILKKYEFGEIQIVM